MEDFEYDTVKATIDLKSSEIEFDKKLNWDILEKGINKVNSHISQSHPINSKFFDKENIKNVAMGAVGIGQKKHNKFQYYDLYNWSEKTKGLTLIYGEHEFDPNIWEHEHAKKLAETRFSRIKKTS